MNTQQKFDLIVRNTEEIITKEDLKNLLKNNEKLNHYIGFEISGKIHIGTGLMCMSKVKDFMDAGVDCAIFLADWHSWINDKLGGDMAKIQSVAVGYFKEGIKASFKCVGGDPTKLKFILGSELYYNNNKYWATMVEVSKNTTLSRINRSISILGRKEGDAVDFAKLLYPPMQVADIFSLGVNLPHAGLDQRKAQVIGRDVALKLKINPLLNKNRNKIKPVAVHHHLILGLGKPPVWPVPKDRLQELWSLLKMSKSKPKTCIFIHDSPEDIRIKIKEAFCPEGETEFNPLLDWVKYLIFKDKDSKLQIKRPEKFGGNKIYTSYSDLETDFAQKNLHPLDLKLAVAEKIIEILEPAREHFKKPKVKAMLDELEKMMITR
ncbi:MAG: tyrosine--tRNA ligase [Candidatus Huberarchaeum crystalense]|uniref:tyrosine--tRNA ligase n=1 Tax=Huberarchaeum crystalense TaxID=2014257 RepID=A0A2G9LJP8_HUBC1|nr:tyrosine--tRNA ligase [archaeon]OIP20466.1 MAG: tyrosine--tRNA ligase [archaeon CG2_30_31_98]PIN66767.1 MAG: tyrosine--tRNA ligase [Candidatus Huberarchaeum crystalense]NCS98341.1 tyrosine--tRNA ligase [archaeon]PIV13795.1 MAG: tyrosine--tRNA ligase [Candidatus Huberarchaeum crystalense]